MKLLIFGDIHHDLAALKKAAAKEADLYICHGDLSNLGEGLKKGGEILAALEKKLWLMPGNNEIWKQTQALCQKYGFVDFHQKIIKKKDFVFAGLGYSTPTPFNTPGEVNEEGFTQALKKFQHYQNLCLVTHNPPRDSQLDVLPGGAHVGSQAIRKFIEKEQPIYFFSGHIHENEGKVQRIGQTTCFGVGKKGLEIWL